MAVALDFERSGISVFARGRRTIEEICDALRDRPADQQRNPSIRYELADRAVEVAVGTHLAHRITHMQTQDIIANHEASVSKLFGSELTQRIAATGLKTLGLYGGLGGRDRADDANSYTPLGGRLARDYLLSVSATIAAGTSEIQRGIIATRGLGLPRL
jgi:alkylation response protein AidB-like acyl-CoA dehydrogenase